MLVHLIVQPISEGAFPFSERRGLRHRQIEKPTDSKVKTLVLRQIARKGKTGALFPTDTAPKVMIHVPKRIEKEKQMIPGRPCPERLMLRPPLSRVPVGLRQYAPYYWINSLIQFLLFLPGSWELFSLVPRSCQPLREFVDKYVADQEENRPVSSADSTEFMQWLVYKLPSQFLQKNFSLYDILSAFMKSLFPHCPFSLPGEIHPVILHPEWHVVSDVEQAFSSLIQKKMDAKPLEILVGFHGAFFPLKGHYLSSSDGAFYDLDAFIELRPDGETRGHAIAYLKCEGVWYQCDDDRIVRFRSNCLSAPLQRATLLHYQKSKLGSDRRRSYL